MNLSKILTGVMLSSVLASTIALGATVYNFNNFQSVPNANEIIYEDHGFYRVRDYSKIKNLPSPDREDAQKYLDRYFNFRSALGITCLLTLFAGLSAAALEDKISKD